MRRFSCHPARVSQKKKDTHERRKHRAMHQSGHDLTTMQYSAWYCDGGGGGGGGGLVIYNAITLVFTAVSNQGDNLVTN